MTVALKNFSDDEVTISQHQAWVILKYFWPNKEIVEGQLNMRWRAFAQALLLEAIDGSYAMGYISALFDTAYGKVPGCFPDVKEIVTEFMKAAAKHWFKHQGSKKIEDAQIYVSVKQSLARNFRSVIEQLDMEMDPLY